MQKDAGKRSHTKKSLRTPIPRFPTPLYPWLSPLLFTFYVDRHIRIDEGHSGPDLPIGYVGLSLGPQDPRGPPTNCGTHSQFPVYDQFDKYSSTIYVLIIHEI